MTKIFNTKEELSHFFAMWLVQCVQNIPEEQHFCIALSGGSTPKALFSYLALHFRDKIEWDKLLIFWGDERCVPPENNESNFKMAKENLLELVPIPIKNIFRIYGEKDPHNEAERYSKVVKNYVVLRDTIPQFDLIMLGLGDDGHTASIFPGNLHLFETKNSFEVAEHPQTNQKRITMTGKTINNALNVAFLVTGSSKADIIEKLFKKKNGWEHLPASMVHPKNGKLLWLLDERSTINLNSKMKL